VTAECMVFQPMRLSAPCGLCGVWPERPHVVGKRFYCGDCCSVCNPAADERTTLPTVISGSQNPLF
jgi:hypothetical protein